MVGKIGYILYDMEVIGKGQSTRLEMTMVLPSSTSESGEYSPAESVNATIYNPEHVEKFAEQIKTLAKELRTNRGNK